MKTLLKQKTYLFRRLLAGLLCLALFLSPAGLDLARAQGAPAQSGCPQAKSLDSQRMAKYRAVISTPDKKGYLDELEKLCNNPHPAVREYLAQRVMGNDLVTTQALTVLNIPLPPEGRLKAEFYPALLKEVNRVIADFKEKSKNLRIATGELAFGGTPDEQGNCSKVWLASKDAETEYPKDYDYQGRIYPRNPAEKADASAYLTLLNAGNNGVVAAFAQYLAAIKGYAQSKELVVAAGQRAQKAIFDQAKELARYCWRLNKFIPRFRAEYYQTKYARDDLFYAHYASYYSRLCNLFAARVQQGLLEVRYEDSVYYGDWLWLLMKVTVQGRNSLLSIYGWQKQHKESFRECIATTAEGGWDGQVGKELMVPEGASLIGPPLDAGKPVWPADCGRGRFQQALQADNAARSSFHQGAIELLTGLKGDLNKALDTSASELPFHNPYRIDLENHYYLLHGGPTLDQPPYVEGDPVNAGSELMYIDGEQTKISNKLPIAFSEDKISDTTAVTLKAPSDKIKDKDADELNYRWVIIGIPETENAKSQRYALYQTLSQKETCQFKPDLAGKWVLALEVNDKQLPLLRQEADGKPRDYATIVFNAIRHILWIAHDDKETTLQLYNYVNARKGVNTEYYLEVAHEKVGIYQNFDDQGMPVDIDNYSGPVNGATCFKIFAKASAQSKGIYDGKYGSTNLRDINPDTQRTNYDSFTLLSASNRGEDIPIEVRVIDPAITDLVLSNKDYPYQKQTTLSGTYHIQQWVDHEVWLNNSGTGFSRIIKRKAMDYYYCPDWMERRAAETLNKFPEVLPFVQRIHEGSALGKFSLFLDTAGYKWGRKEIFLEPEAFVIRYNAPMPNNGYGFYAERGLDMAARHEAHHSFYWHKVISNWAKQNNNIDLDGDSLPNTTANGMFKYLYDSPGNEYGGYGPFVPGLGTKYPVAYTYIGDRQKDIDYGKVKKFIQQEEFLRSDIPAEIKPFLPKEWPINDVQPMFYFKASEGLLKHTVVLTQDYHYSYKLDDLMTPQPKIIITLKKNPLEKLLSEAESKGWTFTDTDNKIKLYVNYRVFTPPFFGIYEFDAARIEPATYVGHWGLCERIVF